MLESKQAVISPRLQPGTVVTVLIIYRLSTPAESLVYAFQMVVRPFIYKTFFKLSFILSECGELFFCHSESSEESIFLSTESMIDTIFSIYYSLPFPVSEVYEKWLCNGDIGLSYFSPFSVTNVFEKCFSCGLHAYPRGISENYY